MGRRDDVDLLRDLAGIALRSGYVDAYLLYAGLPMDVTVLRREVGTLAAELQPVIRLFALGQRVAPADLVPTLGAEVVDALERLRVLLRDDDGLLHAAGMCLVPFHGHLVLVPSPHGSPVAMFGDDTTALASRLAPRRGARCLHLCAGPGALALRLADTAEHVIAIEEHELALACAELNAVMNGLDDRITLRKGFAQDALRADERFDHVSADPPLLPFPRGLFRDRNVLPLHDEEPTSLTERIIALLPAVMKRSGTAQLVGSDLGDAGGPRIQRLLDSHAAQHGLSSALTVVTQAPLSAGARLLEALAQNSARAGVLSAAESTERMLAHLAQTGCDRLYLFYLAAVLGEPPGAVVVSRPDQLGGGYWYR